jgi:predicted transcriptional regulator
MKRRDLYHLKRRKLGITLKEIADFLNVHHTSISRHETGKINFSRADEYYNYIDNTEKELNNK